MLAASSILVLLEFVLLWKARGEVKGLGGLVPPSRPRRHRLLYSHYHPTCITIVQVDQKNVPWCFKALFNFRGRDVFWIQAWVLGWPCAKKFSMMKFPRWSWRAPLYFFASPFIFFTSPFIFFTSPFIFFPSPFCFCHEALLFFSRAPLYFFLKTLYFFTSPFIFFHEPLYCQRCQSVPSQAWVPRTEYQQRTNNERNHRKLFFSRCLFEQKFWWRCWCWRCRWCHWGSLSTELVCIASPCTGMYSLFQSPSFDRRR